MDDDEADEAEAREALEKEDADERRVAGGGAAAAVAATIMPPLPGVRLDSKKLLFRLAPFLGVVAVAVLLLLTFRAVSSFNSCRGNELVEWRVFTALPTRPLPPPLLLLLLLP